MASEKKPGQGTIKIPSDAKISPMPKGKGLASDADMDAVVDMTLGMGGGVKKVGKAVKPRSPAKPIPETWENTTPDRFNQFIKFAEGMELSGGMGLPPLEMINSLWKLFTRTVK